MEPRPLVALTTSFDPAAGTHLQPQVVIYGAYIAALEDAGLAPVLVSPAHSPPSIDALMDHCYGLVLSGGGDVDPARYGEAPRAELDSVSAERDEAEFTALRIAIERRLPIFGICRGIQVLNVYLGGTLFQDIDQDRGLKGQPHQQSPAWNSRAHNVDVSPGSMLHDVLGGSRLRINSFHHQAIRQVAPGLSVCALAEDGLVEAVEMSDHPWGLAVQWHPERREASSPETDPDRLLFTAFARAVAARRLPQVTAAR